MTLTPGPKEVEFNDWYDTKFKPAMERGPLDKYVARQAWFASARAIEAAAIESFLNDSGQYLTNDATREATIAAATAPLLARIAELERQLSQPVGEPVYQYQRADGSWIDQTKASHDYNVSHGQATVRTLYTHPAHGKDAP